MRFFSYFLCYLQIANAWINVSPTINHQREWSVVITNKGIDSITTKVNTRIRVYDRKGKQVDKFELPLQAIHLGQNQSIIAALPFPLTLYDEQVTLSCIFNFIDVKKHISATMQH